MVGWLKKTYKKFTNNDALTRSIEEQKTFFIRFNEDMDFIDRVYAKYLCRKFMAPSLVYFIILNMVSLAVFAPMWLFYRVKVLSCKTIEGKCQKEVIIRKDKAFGKIDDIVPQVIVKKYQNISFVEMKQYKKGWLDKEAAHLLHVLIKKHPFCFYMNFMAMINLSDYCRIIDCYKPLSIISYAQERNFEKPLVTEYCHIRGVKHEAFMHGECFYQIDKGLLYYDTYYVWDDYYSNLFHDLKCKCEYVVYTPTRLYHNITPINSYKDTEYFLTYYLGAESDETLMNIYTLVKKLNDQGFQCKVRSHPRAGNKEKVNELFGPLLERCSVDESLEKTFCAAALCSTVQEEAYYSGRAVVCDDWSDVDRFKDIESKGYAMLEKPHLNVSELLSMLEDGKLVEYLNSSSQLIRGENG